MKKAVLLALLLLAPRLALCQSSPTYQSGPQSIMLGWNSSIKQFQSLRVDSNSGWLGMILEGGSITPPASNSGTPTQATGACTTSSSTILAASSATTSESFHLASTAANPVWLNFAGAAATQASPNFDLAPGVTITFTAASGLLPTSAVTCIASAATSVTEIFK